MKFLVATSVTVDGVTLLLAKCTYLQIMTLRWPNDDPKPHTNISLQLPLWGDHRLPVDLTPVFDKPVA